MNRVRIGALALVALAGAIALARADVTPEAAVIDVAYDFVDAFDDSRVDNSLNASASRDERSGRVSLPGIFLHPQNADDAVVSYADVQVPACRGDERSLLLFHIGFRDDVPWDDPRANGVRFIIRVNGEEAFAEDVRGAGWRARVLDVTPYAGQAVAIDWRTNAIDGGTGYDWCVFGQPLLAHFVGTTRYTDLADGVVGVAVARVESRGASRVTLTMGDAKVSQALSPGVNLMALPFKNIAVAALAVDEGEALLGDVQAAPYAARLECTEVALSSPHLSVGLPFNVVATFKNTGLGRYPGGERIALGTEDGRGVERFGAAAGETPETGVIESGGTATLCWRGLMTTTPGTFTLTEPRAITFEVGRPEPAPWLDRPDVDAVSTATPEHDVIAGVANPWCQLRIVMSDKPGPYYGIAETWNGETWQRVATLFPLVSVEMRARDGCVYPLMFLRQDFTEGRDKVQRLFFVAKDPDGGMWRAEVAAKAHGKDPRIRISCSLEAPVGADVVSFSGPTVLAGDRSFGEKKDFAIFPGLEYLEGDEPSSSDRDLAYPLCDRRVPAVHKVAAPIMAAQGDDALVALLWDAKQEWAPGQRHPAARFLAPPFDAGIEHIHMSLFAPSVGEYVEENAYGAYETPYHVGSESAGALRLDAWLVLDHASRYPEGNVVHGAHTGGLVVQAVKHWFDAFGFPAPSPMPRPWDEERALCRYAYANGVWSEDPPGWRHCYNWEPGLFVGHAVPQLLDIRAGVPEDVRREGERRIGLVLDRAIREQGRHFLWTGGGCHILVGELPFFYGYVAESMQDFRNNAFRLLDGREQGLWVWHPAGEKYASLGKDGDHTLGQAAHGAFIVLRAARMTGDRDLIAQALTAMKQMEQYEVPRGAQMWECPMYQPDILAAANAIRAYCEAYRLTGDETHLDHARYWAWTGLPFLYLWDREGYPTMRYNVISVIGSTFFTHSWLGLPVVWCGEVYAYALQELAQFDDSLDWRRLAEGINRSAMWQQYPDGPSQGCYPDSWNMVKNRPNPADISPENILVNEFRLRGFSPEIRSHRFQGEDGVVMLNSAGDIMDAALGRDGSIRFSLNGTTGFAVHTVLSPVPEPGRVDGVGARVSDSDALQSVDNGWLYDENLRGVVFKHTIGDAPIRCSLVW